MCLLNEPATPVTMRSRLNRQRTVGAATTAVTGPTQPRQIEPKQRKETRQNGKNESLHLHGLTQCGLGIITWTMRLQ